MAKRPSGLLDRAWTTSFPGRTLRSSNEAVSSRGNRTDSASWASGRLHQQSGRAISPPPALDGDLVGMGASLEG